MAQTETGIEQIILPKIKDLGGFHVRRSIPTAACRSIGPWVFFDHMGPVDLPAGRNIDVRPHPHINLATVTYLFEGEMIHRDSVGSHQAIQPGDVNLMVAGKGIVHSERERPEAREQDRHLNGLQLWLALPEQFEEIDPAFYHYPSADIPVTSFDGIQVRVMIGHAYGIVSPVKMFADTLYIEAQLQAGDQLALPIAEKRGLYVVKGHVEVNGQDLQEFGMAILDDSNVNVKASKESRIALVGGEQLTPRYMDWNFVSSSKNRITKAADDWRNQRFPKISGDDEEFIPLP